MSVAELRVETSWVPWFRGLGAAALHRIDAWGVALVVCLVVLLVHDAVQPATVLLAAGMGMTYGLGYALNDYFDAPFDAQDRAKAEANFFVAHPVSREKAGLSFAVLAALPVVAFARFGAEGLLLFAVCLLAMWAYSVPPLRLKSRPGLDLLSHALFVQTFAYFGVWVLVGDAFTVADFFLLAINFLASLSGQLAQQVRDFALDARTEHNFSTRVGRETAIVCRRLATGVLVLAVVAGVASGAIPLYLTPIGLAFVPSAVRRLGNSGAALARWRVVLPTLCALVYTGSLVLARWVA